MTKTYRIEVDCANCANKIEEAVNKIEGVKKAVINFMALKIIVEFEEGADVKKVMEMAAAVCKKVERDSEIYF